MSVFRLLSYLALCIIGATLSIWSLIEHINIKFGVKALPLCNISEQISCGAVLGSEFATILGIPLGALGLFFYLGNIFAIVRRTRSSNAAQQGNLLLAVHSISVIFSIYLFLISHFKIGVLCPICLGMYLVNILLFILIFTEQSAGSFLARIGAGITSSPGIVGSFFFEDSQGQESKASLIWWMPIALALSAIFSFSLEPALFLRMESTLRGSMVQEWIAQPEQAIESDLTPGILQDYFKGSPTATVQLVEFFDFQCPACQSYFFFLEDLAREFGDDILIVVRNYPLDNRCNPSIPHRFNSESCFSALFARCAGEQGRYFEAASYLSLLDAEELFEHEIALRDGILSGIETLQLDREAMLECLESDRQQKKIRSDIELGDQLGLQSTPSVWINQKKVPNIHPEVVREIIHHILGR